MQCHDRIISEFAKRECTRIARRIIRKLQKMTDALLSGDDTVLKNTWDEICVQVQFEQSFYWDVYVDEIMHLVSIELNSQPTFVKEAIWLQTDNGLRWIIDNEYKESQSLTSYDGANLGTKSTHDDETIPFNEHDIADYIVREHILVAAGRWHNRRIEAFIDSISSD